MTEGNIKQVIKQLIFKRREAVIEALSASGMGVSKSMDDKALYKVIMSELVDGNESLMINLGAVIDDTFDMSKYTSENFSGAGGAFWKDNAGALIGAGAGLLASFFGKNKAGSSSGGGSSLPTSGGSSVTNQFLMMQQQQAEDRRRDEQRRRDEDAARRSSNMMIFGIIGGVVLIGGIITFVATR